MQFSENRKIAFAVLAVCVLVSVFGLGGMGLARERSKVLNVYDRGTDTTMSTRHSMDAYLDSAAESARLMASEAGLFLSGGQSQLAEEMEALAEQLDTAADTDARFEAYSAVKTASDKLYNAVYDAAGDKFTNFKKAYDDFWGYDDMIRHDEYHQLAAGYNDLISGFPGGIVARLVGQGALNTFGG